MGEDDIVRIEDKYGRKNRVSLENKKIWIVGHNGMVGNSILNKLKKFKSNILVTEKKELDEGAKKKF